jgi:hypothetical protein
MDVEMVEKVKAYLREEPRRLYMGDWIRASLQAPCGTVCCIAGAAIIVGTDIKDARMFNRSAVPPEDTASRLLDINPNQADVLFYVTRWPREFQEEYADAGALSFPQAYEKKVEVVCSRLDYMLKTGW